MRSLRIVFMGSPDFAVPSLDRIHGSEHTLAAVVSNPDKRRGRRGKAEPTAVKKRALELGYPVIDAEDIKSAGFERSISRLQPDLLVVVAFRILPPAILAIPSAGSVNLHASLLPKYRGAAPIHWAIINGEKETGCSVFFLNEEVDTGKIIRQRKTGIGGFETTGDLYNRLKEAGADLLAESIDDIARGDVHPLPQKEELATPAPKLHRENTRINFNRSAGDLHNFIRGLNPFPVAWCTCDKKKMNIYSAVPHPKKMMEPGELQFEDGILFAGCGEGALEIRELQLPGTKKMTGRDFANGFDLSKRLL